MDTENIAKKDVGTVEKTCEITRFFLNNPMPWDRFLEGDQKMIEMQHQY